MHNSSAATQLELTFLIEYIENMVGHLYGFGCVCYVIIVRYEYVSAYVHAHACVISNC